MSSSVAGGVGYVLRPTLAGRPIRPTFVMPSTRRSVAQVEDTANGSCARTPNRQPRQPGGMARRGMPPKDETGRRWCPRAQAPFAVSSTYPGRNRVDAAARCSLRRGPASVGRRTGASPSPCRHDDSRPARYQQSATRRKRTLPARLPYAIERQLVSEALAVMGRISQGRVCRWGWLEPKVPNAFSVSRQVFPLVQPVEVIDW